MTARNKDCWVAIHKKKIYLQKLFRSTCDEVCSSLNELTFREFLIKVDFNKRLA